MNWMLWTYFIGMISCFFGMITLVRMTQDVDVEEVMWITAISLVPVVNLLVTITTIFLLFPKFGDKVVFKQVDK